MAISSWLVLKVRVREHPGDTVRIDGTERRIVQQAAAGEPRHVAAVFLQPAVQLAMRSARHETR